MGILLLFLSIFSMWNQLFACGLSCWKVFLKQKKKEKCLLKAVVTFLWNPLHDKCNRVHWSEDSNTCSAFSTAVLH